MLDDYVNVLKNQTVTIAGRLLKIDKALACDLIRRTGGRVRNKLDDTTTLLVVGSRPGRANGEALRLGITTWTESELLAALEAFEEYLICRQEQQKSIITFDPLFPAVRTGRLYPDQILGLPVTYTVGKQLFPESLAYAVNHTIKHRFWREPGVDTIKAFAINLMDEDDFSEFMEHLPLFTQLRALHFELQKGQIDGVRTLEALPLLQCLSVSALDSIKFGVLRHSELQQLQLQSAAVIDLELCSFPNLVYLEVNHSDHHYVQQLLEPSRFPRLQHVGFYGPQRNVDILPDLIFSKNICSLGFRLANGHLFEETLADLAAHPVAKQLQYLHVTTIDFNFGGVMTRENFPELKYLKISNVVDQHFEALNVSGVGGLRFDQQLHIDMSRCYIRDHHVLELHHVFDEVGEIQSLNLDENHIVDPELQQSILRLPFPVSLQYQRP